MGFSRMLPPYLLMFITRQRLQTLALAVLFVALGFTGCAQDRPLVKGLFEPGGIIYREDEKEEWGSRSTVKVLGGEF